MKKIIITFSLITLSAIAACAQDGTKPVPNSDAGTAAAKSSAAVMENIERASAFYLRNDFTGAIGPYQKALDLVKGGAKINKTWFRVLVDNLGMSYGITGKLDEAKDIFEYGISKDDEYPLFYYNMACTYAEMDNEEKAIEYLRGAFERKEKMIEGERFPNPETDSSFKKFMKSQKFIAALAEMKTPRKKA